MAELRQNTWQLDEWYAQAVAGNAGYNGEGQMWMFGRNWEYQLTNSPAFMPNNPNSWRSSPVQLTAASGTWTGGANHPGGTTQAFGVKGDGSVWVWGKAGPVNSLGLNQPGNTTASSPKQVMAAPSGGYKSRVITGEGNLQVSVTNNGEMYTWGQGNYGQLGLNLDGPSDWRKRSSPTQIPGTWSMNFTCNAHAVMAVKTDGTLWSWGRSQVGELGLNVGNPNIKVSSPTQVGTDTNWSTTEGHCNIGPGSATQAGCTKTDGTMWVWGWNGDAGVLGLSQSGGQTANARSSPTQLPGSTWGTVAGGNGSIAMSVKTDGTLWTWGDNQYGRLGLNEQGNHGTGDSYSSPKQVGTDTTWYRAWTTGNAQWATKTDSTLWVWGQNNPKGLLGLNDQTNRSSPTQLPGSWVKDADNGFGGNRTMLFKEL